ncbi:50S ribosomal protein L15 [Candidatus Daviesbacteria bacterium]|nr:50S ribosomal protein L15 [Candidatus Daviesbacteria bacterium]
MNLNSLHKIKARSKKRVGRGLGSGLGKTAGRGSKGQKARGKMPVGFVGSLPLYKKLPLKKGKGNPKLSSKPVAVKLSRLSTFAAKSSINIAKLIEAKIVSEKEARKGVKILGAGEVKSGLVVQVPISKAAQQIIEKAGGRVENA